MVNSSWFGSYNAKTVSAGIDLNPYAADSQFDLHAK